MEEAYITVDDRRTLYDRGAQAVERTEGTGSHRPGYLGRGRRFQIRKLKHAVVFVLAVTLAGVAAGNAGVLPRGRVLAEERGVRPSETMRNAPQQAHVYFVRPVQAEKALAEAASYQSQVVELRYSIHAIDQDVQGGYFLQPDLSPQENVRQYEQTCGESIASVVQQVEDAIATTTAAQAQSPWQHQLAILTRVQAQLRESGVKVTSMIVEGDWSNIVAAKGDADTDTAKLFAQLGHRTPSSCYSTWCVFADQTEVILNAWVISIPGDRAWSR